MDYASIVVAIITGIATVITVALSNRSASKQMDAKLEQQLAVFEATVSERIRVLTEKVEKHNSTIERTYKLETDSAVQDAEIRRINHRLSTLEQRREEK